MKISFLITLLFATTSLFAQSKKPLFTFGVVADVQYADQANTGTRYYRLSPQKLMEAVEVFNKQKVNFVISLGDFIDKNFSSFDTLNPIVKKLKMPLRHVLGNHEFSVRDEEKEKVLEKENLKDPYYSFDKKGWRFIMLNGNDISLYSNNKGSIKYLQADSILKKLKAAGLKNAQTWNGAMGKEHLLWLTKELASAAKKNQKVILTSHFPLYPDGESELLWNAGEVRALVEKPGVFAYLNGHVHKSQYFPIHGVHFVSFRGMVELADNSFAIVSVYKDHLEIKGYGKEVSRSLNRL